MLLSRFGQGLALARSGIRRSAVAGGALDLSFWPAPPRYLLVELEGCDGPLAPTLHWQSGDDPEPSRSLALRPARRLLCLVALRSLGAKRLRLDPGAQPGGAYRFRARSLYRKRGVRRLVGRWLAGRPRAAKAVLEIVGDEGWGAAEGGRRGRDILLGPADYFDQIVALAAELPPAIGAGEAAEPFVSLIVPVYDTAPRYLDELLASVRAQEGVAAELILSDDGSSRAETRAWLERHAAEPGIAVLTADANRGIAAATNAGLAAARGIWVGFLDHDDALAPFALKVAARALQGRPETQFAYTDEAIADGGLRVTGFFAKPAYDPVLLSGVNYINHLSLYRRERLQSLGGLKDGFQGSQDYELLLRYLAALRPEEVLHLPYPAYLWRRDGASYSASFLDVATASARRALAGRYGAPGSPAPVEPALLPDLHRVRLDRAIAEWPPISVVIPSRDGFALLKTLLDGLADGTDYPALEVIVVDNGSTDPRVFALYEASKRRFPAFRAEVNPEPFNFSRSVNRGIAMAAGERVLLLNNDIEILEPGWLREMAACFAYPGTGIVGARLLYPDRRIQHAGVVVGFGGLAAHWFAGAPERFYGPMGRLAVRQSFTAVTAAAMLVSRDCIERTGPFDEAAFAIAYNDVDFCLRAGAAGFRTLWTPFATLLHRESASRGSDERPETIERFREEQQHLQQRHATETYEDRAASPFYSRGYANPIYRFLRRLPEPR
jgi:GT2 family glycosyltransferase